MERRLTRKRLLGIDRSGPEPPETRAGAPLRPFTIPNLVGYIRLALLAAFCYLVFGSDDGRVASATALFAIVAWSDYLDGILARLTGQYSRLGALLDPFVDRLLVLSGVVVCWHFDLLPHWALVVLLAREVVTATMAEIGLRRGLDLEIKMIGRLAVWPTMSALFFALATEGWVAPALLYLGLVMSLAATALYARDGLRRLAEQRGAT